MAMASTGEEPLSSPNAPAVLADPSDVKDMKVLPSKVAATSSNKPIAPEPTAAIINPVLLSSACSGSWKGLTFLFKREDAGRAPIMMPTREFMDSLAPGSSTIDDVEEGIVDEPALPATAPLLNGVTTAGDTALHVVASHGEQEEFLKCADIIYHKAKHLLFALNNEGDTPLHCAARAGRSKMVSRLIDLAATEDGQDTHHRKHELMRMVNKHQETALHYAVRIGDEGVVKKLMESDPELANYPKERGISPLYLAILLGKDSIARTLHHESKENLSYSGPKGQNALHIAIFRDTGLTKQVLEWNKSLTTQRDGDGSTPLHFASSFLSMYWRLQLLCRPPWLRFSWQVPRNSFRTLVDVFNANTTAMYQADNNGLFPIHVAASVDARPTIQFFLDKCPNTARLCDAKGRTFLHVAVVEKSLSVVQFVCQTPSLAWTLNMQDNDGNTALHLAAQAGKFRIFCALLGTLEVQLNLTNNQGQTPLDLSRSNLPRGMGYGLNSENQIFKALKFFGAKHGALRWDKSKEKYSRAPKDKNKESERLKDATQMFIVGSVLIASVAFGATFALPGGYRADDHTNGGTPTLYGTYAFDAFMMATTLSFICSSIATIGFMLSGIPIVNLDTRSVYLVIAFVLMASSVTSMSAAFALGVYMVLDPVSRNTAIVICVTIPLVVISTLAESLLKWAGLARPLYVRKGKFRGIVLILGRAFGILFGALWPFVVIFGWATFSRIHHHHR